MKKYIHTLLVVGVLVGDNVGDAEIPSQVTGSPSESTTSPVHSLSELQHETTAELTLS